MGRKNTVTAGWLFIAVILITIKVTFGDEKASGLVLYKEHIDDPDLLTYAMEYKKVGVFNLVINAVPVSQNQARRFMRKNVISLIPYIDLETANIRSESEVAKLKLELESLTNIAKEFPSTRGTTSERIAQLKNAVGAFDSGLVLQNGNWIRRDFNKNSRVGMNSLNSEKNQIDNFVGDKLVLKERILVGAKLTGISNANAKIRHSGGFVVVPISDLTDDQIMQLNSTSIELQIDRNLISAAPPKPTADQSKPPSQLTVTGLTSTPETLRPPSNTDPDSFIREVNLFLPTLLENTSASASDDWHSLPSTDITKLENLINIGNNLQSKARENESVANAQQMLVAFERSSKAAKLWSAKEGTKAIQEYFLIEFPTNFERTEQFADAWRTLASLRRDLEGRNRNCQEILKRVDSLLKEEPPKFSVLEEAITESLEEIPDVQLEERRDNFREQLREERKNSLGL